MIARVGLWTSGFAALAMGLAGCSDSGASGRGADEIFDSAMTRLATAEQDFVGAEALAEADATGRPSAKHLDDLGGYFAPMQEQERVAQFRQDQFESAKAELEKLLDPATQATLEQQIAARRLLANIYASHARHRMRHALTEWALLSTELSSLVAQHVTVSNIDKRAQIYNRDAEPMIAQLRKDLETKRALRDTLSAEMDERKKTFEALTGEAGGHKEQFAALQKKAIDQRTTSEAAEGDEQFNLQMEAIKTQRDADAASAEAEKVNVRQDIVQSELDLLQRQVMLTSEAIANLEQQIAQAEQRQKDTHATFDATIGERDEAGDALQLLVTDVLAKRAKSVDTPLSEAFKFYEQANELREASVAAAPSSSRKDLQLELLAGYVAEAYLLTQQIATTHELAETLEVMSNYAGRNTPIKEPFYGQAAEDQRRKRNVLRDTLGSISGKAFELATSIMEGLTEGDPIAQEVARQVSILQGLAGETSAPANPA